MPKKLSVLTCKNLWPRYILIEWTVKSLVQIYSQNWIIQDHNYPMPTSNTFILGFEMKPQWPIGPSSQLLHPPRPRQILHSPALYSAGMAI